MLRYPRKGIYWISAALLLAILVACSEKTPVEKAPTPPSTNSLIEFSDAPPYPYRTFTTENGIWIIDGQQKLWHSADLGKNWNPYPHPVKSPIESMLFSDSGMIGLITDELGYLHRTTDGGDTWSSVSLAESFLESPTSAKDYYWTDIKFGHTDSSLYFDFYCNIFHSPDLGNTWVNLTENIGPTSRDRCVNSSYLNEENKISHAAVTWGDGWKAKSSLYASNDLGESWTPLCPATVTSVLEGSFPSCPDKSDEPDQYFPTTEGYSFYSQEFDESVSNAIEEISKSRTIKNIDSSLLKAMVYDGAISKKGSRYWHYYGDALLYSDDNGNTWQVALSNLPLTERYSYTGFAVNGTMYFDDMEGTISYSSDAGVNWQPLVAPNGYKVRKMQHVAKNSSLLVATENSLYAITEDSDTWRTVKSYNGSINRIAIVGNSHWVITYNPEGNYSVNLSTDSGTTWLPGKRIEVQDRRISCGKKSCLFGGYDNNLALYSLDSNNQPTIKEIDLTLPDTDLYFDIHWQEDKEIIWLIDNETVLYSSKDLGKSWTKEFKTDMSRSFLQPTDGGNVFLFADTEGFFEFDVIHYKLTDNGWVKQSIIPEIFNLDKYAQCWLNDTQWLLHIYPDDKDKQSHTLLTNNSGENWYPIDFPHTAAGQPAFDVCIQWKDKLQVDDTIITFK